MMVIEGDRYRAEQVALRTDPIIREMAREILRDYERDFGERGYEDAMDRLVNEQGEVRWDFTRAASDEYRNRDGKLATSIGGPGKAVVAVLKELHAAASETPETPGSS